MKQYMFDETDERTNNYGLTNNQSSILSAINGQLLNNAEDYGKQLRTTNNTNDTLQNMIMKIYLNDFDDFVKQFNNDGSSANFKVFIYNKDRTSANDSINRNVVLPYIATNIEYAANHLESNYASMNNVQKTNWKNAHLGIANGFTDLTIRDAILKSLRQLYQYDPSAKKASWTTSKINSKFNSLSDIFTEYQKAKQENAKNHSNKNQSLVNAYKEKLVKGASLTKELICLSLLYQRALLNVGDKFYVKSKLRGISIGDFLGQFDPMFTSIDLNKEFIIAKSDKKNPVTQINLDTLDDIFTRGVIFVNNKCNLDLAKKSYKTGSTNVDTNTKNEDELKKVDNL